LTPENGWVGSDFGGVTASWAKFLGGLNLLVSLSKSVGKKRRKKAHLIKHMVFIGETFLLANEDSIVDRFHEVFREVKQNPPVT